MGLTDELLGSALCLARLDDGGRCHELLARDERLPTIWRCAAGHTWKATAQVMGPGDRCR